MPIFTETTNSLLTYGLYLALSRGRIVSFPKDCCGFFSNVTQILFLRVFFLSSRPWPHFTGKSIKGRKSPKQSPQLKSQSTILRSHTCPRDILFYVFDEDTIQLFWQISKSGLQIWHTSGAFSWGLEVSCKASLHLIFIAYAIDSNINSKKEVQ